MTGLQSEDVATAAFVQKIGEFEVQEIAACDIPFAHEAGIWLPATREVVFTSNQFIPEGKGGKTLVTISILSLDDDSIRTVLPSPAIEAANGGTNYKGAALICQQGQGDVPGALVLMDVTEPYKTTVLLDSFYGKPFNSPNDVVVLGLDGSIWFTDPDYGYEQGLFSTPPQLPNQVYCYDPKRETVRAVANGFVKPNGIAFSPDFAVCYVTDTASISFKMKEMSVNCNAPSAIYVFDVVPLPSGSSAGYTLANRRLFAYPDHPAPDGIKIDSNNNVWSACLDGIHVWDQDGVPLGKVPVQGGVANFVFTDPGTIIAFNENRLLRIKNLNVRGVLNTNI